MNSDVKTIKPLPDFRLQVQLHDGHEGVFDMRPYLSHAGLEALRDVAYFNRVDVLFGAATWPDGEDIEPATLAAALQALQTA